MNYNKVLAYKELTEEELEIVSKVFYAPRELVRVGPKGYILFRKFMDIATDIYNLELRHGDVFVTSFPRSGTTWCQELVWLIVNNLDYEAAAAIPLTQRYQFVDFAMYFDEEAVMTIRDNACDTLEMEKAIKRLTTPATQILPSVPSPRFIKSHLPLSLLTNNILDTAKVVYMARDPRDVAVSYYHLLSMLRASRLKGTTFKDFWNSVRNDLCIRMPYFEHVKEAWAQRHHPNMLFLFYEELSSDLPGVINRVADFLGRKITKEQTERLCQHLNIENIRKNKSVNTFSTSAVAGVVKPDGEFIRKGKVGGWREYFDEQMEREAEQWIADNLRGTNLVYPTINLTNIT